jgi:hypothetical protein
MPDATYTECLDDIFSIVSKHSPKGKIVKPIETRLLKSKKIRSLEMSKLLICKTKLLANFVQIGGHHYFFR